MVAVLPRGRQLDVDLPSVEASVAGLQDAAEPELEHVLGRLRGPVLGAVVLDVDEEGAAVLADAGEPGRPAVGRDPEGRDLLGLEVHRLGLAAAGRVLLELERELALRASSLCLDLEVGLAARREL